MYKHKTKLCAQAIQVTYIFCSKPANNENTFHTTDGISLCRCLCTNIFHIVCVPLKIAKINSVRGGTKRTRNWPQFCIWAFWEIGQLATLKVIILHFIYIKA